MSPPAVVLLSGGLDSPCFGGAVVLDTDTPLSIARNEVCPMAGALTAQVEGAMMSGRRKRSESKTSTDM